MSLNIGVAIQGLGSSACAGERAQPHIQSFERSSYAAILEVEHDPALRGDPPGAEGGGATDTQIETMMVENPKRWLSA
jgi:hypothetical protein